MPVGDQRVSMSSCVGDYVEMVYSPLSDHQEDDARLRERFDVEFERLIC